MSARGYISAIAGLRSLAVLSIVAYHLDAAWLPGGFVGVDVFFVISGFVVAHSVAGKPHETFGSYLAAFYKRRFQRILPAAFVYILAAIALSLLFVPLATPTRFMEITGAAATFALSNVFLWLKAGDYFAASSELNLFTHTWSLALEEQYYLLFPLLSYPLFASARPGGIARRAALGFIIGGCIASLIAAAWLSGSKPTFAFYMLPTRFWELGIGFLLRLALTERNTAWLVKHTRAYATVLAGAALGGLALAFVITDPTRFPFSGALLPCFATVLLIAVLWCHPGVWADRLLSLPLPVWIGTISYSLYLWHWGVIVAMRWTVGIDTLPLRLTAFVLMLALAQLSYRLVETPFHNTARRHKPPSLKLFLGYGGAAAAVASLCIAAFVTKPTLGLAAADNVAIWDPYRQPPLPANCPTAKANARFGAGQVFTFPATCTRPDAPNLFILGDSHAGAYQRSAWRIAASGRYRVTLFTLGGCRAISTTALPEVAGCADFLDLARDHIRQAARPGDVIFLPGLHTTRYLDDRGAPADARPLDASLIAASHQRMREFAAIGPAVIVESAKPVATVPLYRCADWFNRGNPDCRPTAAAGAAETLRRMAIADQGLSQAVAGLPGITIWNVGKEMCANGQCPEYVEGKPMFFDSDHLSAYANDRLLPSLTTVIDAASASTRSRPQAQEAAAAP